MAAELNQATAILASAQAHLEQRGASRDKPDGERSMVRVVGAFNALAGTEMTEEQGWLFMVVLKAARAMGGGYNADDYEDGAAYFALAGESAGRGRA